MATIKVEEVVPVYHDLEEDEEEEEEENSYSLEESQYLEQEDSNLGEESYNGDMDQLMAYEVW